MKIILVYKSTDTIYKKLDEYLSSLDLEYTKYDENHHKEKKKAFFVKSSFGTKLTPFVAIYNEENIPLKGFYTDINECTIKNIQKYIQCQK